MVAAAAGGATDMVEDGINGLFVPPGDTARLAEALGRLLGDEALRAKLGRAGAQIVRQRYLFEAFQGALERILGDCGLDSGDWA